MGFWNKARSFAEEAAKRSQELTKEAAKRSQQLTIGSSRFIDLVSETTKRSKEFATEASKRAEQIKIEAAKRADQIKKLSEGISPSAAVPQSESGVEMEEDLKRFGITEELREFVKGITITTFREFPLEDDSQMSDVPMVLNVRQDLTEWQEKHANLVLKAVEEISKLRYQLTPRFMKERKFWRIYFMIVNNHVKPYEKRYMELVILKSFKQIEDDKVKEPISIEMTFMPEVKEETVQHSKISNTLSTDQDLDVFLLGDFGDGDEGPDEKDGELDNDLDKMVNSSDDEKEKL